MIPFDTLQIDPVALGSQGNAVLGIRDSGKTYTATLLAEGLFEAGIPFIAFDPIGVWRFLRVPAAGRGYPVVVAGGQDGDLPLTPASAPAIVEAAMASGVSLVIDLYDMSLSKADWKRIVRSCLQVLLHKNGQHGLRHVFIEEAAEFAPQKVGPDTGMVYAEVEKLARMGGNARLGYTLINQRAEEVNKAVLELCDNLFLHRQKGRHSLTALSKWLDVGNVSDHKAIISTLSTLPTGECWAWLAGTERPVLSKVPTKNSLHPDRRIMRGDVEGVPASKPVDVGTFVKAMREVLEKEAEPEAPKAPPVPAATLKAARAEGVTEGFEAGRRAGTVEGHAEGVRVGVSQALAELRPLIARLEAVAYGEEGTDTLLPSWSDSPAPVDPGPKVVPLRPAPTPAPAPKPAAPRPAVAPADPELVTPRRQMILDAIAWGEIMLKSPSLDRTIVAFLADASPNASGFQNNLGALRSGGMVDYPAAGQVALTDAGRAAARLPERPPTQAQLFEAICQKLPAPQAAIFEVLHEAYPGILTRTSIAMEVGKSEKASGFQNDLGRLRTLGLITYPHTGSAQAAAHLFG